MANTCITLNDMSFNVQNCLIRVNESADDGSNTTTTTATTTVSSPPLSPRSYQAIVADFGLATKIPTCEAERKELQTVGTPYVIAPEVLREKPYDQRVSSTDERVVVV